MAAAAVAAEIRLLVQVVLAAVAQAQLLLARSQEQKIVALAVVVHATVDYLETARTAVQA
jgi:hypothetical protein